MSQRATVSSRNDAAGTSSGAGGAGSVLGAGSVGAALGVPNAGADGPDANDSGAHPASRRTETSTTTTRMGSDMRSE